MNSRTLDFADQIKEKTGGKGKKENENGILVLKILVGVDVILNSLAGEFLLKSVASMAIFGRFIEIGVRDIYANSKLGII